MADANIRRALKALLPPDFGRRRPARLGWLLLALVCALVHVGVTGAVLAGKASGWWMLVTLPVSAFTWPYFFFTLHELGHGALLRPCALRRFACALAAYPIMLQPTFWTAVHNHHHKFANQEDDHDRRRIAGRGEFGERFYEYDSLNPLVVFGLIWAVHLIFYGQLRSYLIKDISFHVSRRRVQFEFALNMILCVSMAWVLGWKLMLFGWLPYAAIGNTLLSLYLISNHLTRPMTVASDSLSTGVSVHLLRGWSHMSCGRHVEHHLFPSVPASQLNKITALLRDKYPDDFREGTLFGTLRQLFGLPGYYLTPRVLTDRAGSRRVSID